MVLRQRRRVDRHRLVAVAVAEAAVEQGRRKYLLVRFHD
jgi:hypothetical protein